MPADHDVRAGDIVARRLHAGLPRRRNAAPSFAELLLVPGVGARTVRALAEVAEVVHGAPIASPTRRGSGSPEAAAPRSVPRAAEVYDRMIAAMKAAVTKAKLGETEELAAIRGSTPRRAGSSVTRRTFVEALFAEERARSHGAGRHERVRAGAGARPACQGARRRRSQPAAGSAVSPDPALRGQSASDAGRIQRMSILELLALSLGLRPAWPPMPYARQASLPYAACGNMTTLRANLTGCPP